MRFVDIRNDVAFRKIFGNSEKSIILISFLNAVLGFEGKQRIEKTVLINFLLLPRLAGEKASIIDVRAIDGNGNTFIVEMQVAEQEGFHKRVLYYTCKDYSQQLAAGKDYTQLKPIYFIGILDFKYFSGDNYLSSHLIIDEETGSNTFPDIKFRFIELPKFKFRKTDAKKLQTVIEKWVFFIKNADKLEVEPDNTDDIGLKEAYTEADRYNWNKEELHSYDYAIMREWDAINREKKVINDAKKLVENTIHKIAKTLLAKGMSIEFVSESTGLTPEAVQQIADEK